METGRSLHEIFGAAFARVRDAVRAGTPLTETALQRWILERFDAQGLTSTDPPTVAVNQHSGDPHFDTQHATDIPIREGDFFLIDAWCKAKRPGSIYADYTQVAFVGSSASAGEATHGASRQATRKARGRRVSWFIWLTR